MSRQPRRWREDAYYHVTHRCHESESLLKFAKHKMFYLKLSKYA